MYCAIILALLPLCLGGKLRFESEDSDTKHWALIVAGSSGWYNYRHQADACHAYHVIRSHGVPDERIVVMMYDDIANSSMNPTPGEIINRPDGRDVYHGVPKDYTGRDVTPKNFLKILQGHHMGDVGSGKVIKSGPNDHVFVNFADHGAPGLIAFPHGELHADDLNDAIQSMSNKNQFKKMLIYIEACESGSMFDKLLPDNINVFATTAANGHESSYACYYDKQRETYLGDVYSVKWMEDSDTEDLKSETLREQFNIVKHETNTSHVQEFGDLTMGDLPVADFQGGVDFKQNRVKYDHKDLNPVPQEDVPLKITENMMRDAKTPAQLERAFLLHQKVRNERDHVTKTFDKIVRLLSNDKISQESVKNQRLTLQDRVCYKRAVSAISRHCFEVGQVDFALRFLYQLINLCESGVHPRTLELVIEDVCK